MTNINLSMDRGDTAEWDVQASIDNAPIDLTGGTVIMTARRNNEVSPVVFTRPAVIDPDQTGNRGKAVVKLLVTDTTSLPNEDLDLVYAIRVVTPTVEVVVAKGTLSVAAVASAL